MFDFTEQQEERFKKLTFLEYLQEMHDRIERISHRPKSDYAYNECSAIVRHVKYRIVKEFQLTWEDFDTKIGKNLRQSAEILNLYGFKDSDKRKGERIREFISEYTYDLSSLIRAAKRREDNPGTTISEDEI